MCYGTDRLSRSADVDGKTAGRAETCAFMKNIRLGGVVYWRHMNEQQKSTARINILILAVPFRFDCDFQKA